MGRFIKKELVIGTLLITILATAGAVGAFWYYKDDKAADSATIVPDTDNNSEHEPELATRELVKGFSNIWDMVFVADDTLVFDDRSGDLHGVTVSTGEEWFIGTVPNVRAEGEGGLLGLARDNEFETNRLMYACYNANGATRAVRVTRFKLSGDFRSANEFTDIITDIESQAGRHSGCRMSMDMENVLWIGTGDSALGAAPQDTGSLAGKVLRVTRDGKGVSGNLSAPNDTRIYNYGHRNIQGLVLLDAPLANGAIGLTAEHGPDKQDEINWLLPGNFGWDPNNQTGRYDESVPMTDTTRFPEAVPAVWNSGSSTIAVSGLTFLTNERWGKWQGWLAVATLKGKHVRLLRITETGKEPQEKVILSSFGRIRAVVEGPNGDLYLATDNGQESDKIIRVSPN